MDNKKIPIWATLSTKQRHEWLTPSQMYQQNEKLMQGIGMPWYGLGHVIGRQRIWINNRSPRSIFCCPKLLQILSPCVSGGGETAGGRGVSAVAGDGERIWSSLGRQKVKPGLLFIIHILCRACTLEIACHRHLPNSIILSSNISL
jgi:hypothetical protein